MTLINRRALFQTAAGAVTLAGAAHAAEIPRASFDAKAIVEAATKAIREEYVDPAVAETLADGLLSNLAHGDYVQFVDPVKFAARLTDDLRATVHDLHLSVSYDPPMPHVENADILTEDALHPRFTGWGLQTTARLTGNIGLLRVTHFPSPPERYADRYAATMTLLQDTNALILDLTTNHGGGEDTVTFFLSYFLEPGLTLSQAISRKGPLEIAKTLATVPGPHYAAQKPIFVAISGNTFSGGEAVAAQLQSHKRATLVGRRTRGGAHMGDFFKLPNDFQIFIVTGKQVDGSDWEGVGVAPDIGTEPEFAVEVAHRLALERLIKQTSDAKTVQVLRNVQNHAVENLSSFAI